MKSLSKRYRKASELVDRDRLYDLPEAVQLLKKAASAKFDETAELAFRLGIDPKKADQALRGTLSLPRGTGQKRRILVFAAGEKARAAQDAGADYVGAKELIEKIQGGWLDFDMVLATPDMMKDLTRLGKTLGPRGLMPSPKSGTVSDDIGNAVREFKGGRVAYKNDAQGNIHLPIGKVSFPEDHLIENAHAAITAIVRSKPASAKGQFLQSITVSSTMGPGIRLNPSRFVR